MIKEQEMTAPEKGMSFFDYEKYTPLKGIFTFLGLIGNPIVDEKKQTADLHKMLKDFCMLVCDKNFNMNDYASLTGWEHLKNLYNKNEKSNLRYYVFKKADSIVIVCDFSLAKYRIDDIYNHFLKGFGLPEFKEGIDFYETVKKQFPKEKIYITGQLIGGSIAEFVALYKTEAICVTFNGIGISPLYPGFSNEISIPNITNYISSRVKKFFRNKHFGEVRMVYIPAYSTSAGNVLLKDFDNLQCFQTKYLATA